MLTKKNKIKNYKNLSVNYLNVAERTVNSFYYAKHFSI